MIDAEYTKQRCQSNVKAENWFNFLLCFWIDLPFEMTEAVKILNYGLLSLKNENNICKWLPLLQKH